MNLLAVCLCSIASYVVAEEPVEVDLSGGEQYTRIYSLENSGLLPIVPASTTLLAAPYNVGGRSSLATPYHGGRPGSGGIRGVGNIIGGLVGAIAGGISGSRPNQHGSHGAYPHNNNNYPGGYPNNNNNYPGGYPNNNNNYPGGYPNNNNNGQSSSCKYWCRTPSNQAYCCEGQNQQNGGGNVGTKPGFCPPVRPSCPPTRIHGPPRQCSNDYSCSGRDKCCFDTCLQHHTCKPIQGGGYGGGYGR